MVRSSGGQSQGTSRPVLLPDGLKKHRMRDRERENEIEIERGCNRGIAWLGVVEVPSRGILKA